MIKLGFRINESSAKWKGLFAVLILYMCGGDSTSQIHGHFLDAVILIQLI